MNRDDIWIIILGLAIGSYALRFTFLGLIGNRPMPDWLLRHLRYTAVSILPALVAPLVVWPSATGGEVDPARLSAGIATFAVGYMTRSLYAAVAAGAGVLTALLLLLP